MHTIKLTKTIGREVGELSLRQPSTRDLIKHWRYVSAKGGLDYAASAALIADLSGESTYTIDQLNIKDTNAVHVALNEMMKPVASRLDVREPKLKEALQDAPYKADAELDPEAALRLLVRVSERSLADLYDMPAGEGLTAIATIAVMTPGTAEDLKNLAMGLMFGAELGLEILDLPISDALQVYELAAKYRDIERQRQNKENEAKGIEYLN